MTFQTQKIIGIIAGNGKFPVLSARQAVQEGYRVIVCAIENEADPLIEKTAAKIQWVKVGEIKKVKKFFQKEQVQEAIMAGKIEKIRLFQKNVRPDLDMVKVLIRLRDFKDDSLLAGIAAYLEENGIRLMDSTLFLKDMLPGLGLLSSKRPSKELWENIRFGFKMAKAIAGLDIGQTAVVKKRAILAVEAIEGTDAAIRRGSELGNGKITVVKVAKPNQDMRFDVPAVGLKTMNELIEAKAEAFAFEAGKTILLDREDFIERANKHGMTVIGVNENS